MANWDIKVTEKCNGCGKCEPVCMYGAIAIDAVNKKAVINNVFCNSCDECIDICPEGAIQNG